MRYKNRYLGLYLVYHIYVMLTFLCKFFLVFIIPNQMKFTRLNPKLYLQYLHIILNNIQDTCLLSAPQQCILRKVFRGFGYGICLYAMCIYVRVLYELNMISMPTGGDPNRWNWPDTRFRGWFSLSNDPVSILSNCAMQKTFYHWTMANKCYVSE